MFDSIASTVRATWDQDDAVTTTLLEGIVHAARLASMAEATQLSLVAQLADHRFRRQQQDQRALMDAYAAHGKVPPLPLLVGLDESDRFTGDEVAAALRLSPTTGATRVHLARCLVEGAPSTWAALARADIDLPRARHISDAVEVLIADAPDTAAAVEQACLATAPDQTAAQVARTARRLVMAADPAAADRRHRRAHARREARVTPLDDGMAQLSVTGRADHVSAAWQGATALAEHRLSQWAADEASGGCRDAEADADKPTLAQARADAILALLSTPEALDAMAGQGGSSMPAPDLRAQVIVPLEALTGAGAHPGDLDSDPHSDDLDGDPHSDDLDNDPHSDDLDNDPHSDDLDSTADTEHAEAGLDGGAASSPPGPAAAPVPSCVPAELVGHGPLPPAALTDILLDLLGAARDHGGQATATPVLANLLDEAASRGRVALSRWLTDPTGVVTAASTRTYPGYRPPPSLERLIRARDATCRFPGCARSATRCDLDHVVSHPRGATTASNLVALCRRHHRLKTHTRWQVRALPGAVLEWCSPTGRTYRTEPPDRLRSQLLLREAAAVRRAKAAAAVAAEPPF